MVTSVPIKNSEEQLESASSNVNSQSRSYAANLARLTARHPIKSLLGTLFLATAISAIGMIVGGFKLEVDNKGWRSRGTLISDREMQSEVLNRNRNRLMEDEDGTEWENMQNEVYNGGYVDLEDRESEFDRRRQLKVKSYDYQLHPGGGKNFQSIFTKESHATENDTCDMWWYDNIDWVINTDNLFAIWKVQPSAGVADKSILDKDVLSMICDAETNTLLELENAGLCDGCDNGKCIPPHSLLLILRHYIDGSDMSCSELMNAYTDTIQDQFTSMLVECSIQVKTQWDPVSQQFLGETPACPQYFLPSLIDYSFGVEGETILRYTSSYYKTVKNEDTYDDIFTSNDGIFSLFEEGAFDGADGKLVRGVYDTRTQAINVRLTDSLVVDDMILAVASLGITFAAMAIHTKSLWLTLMGVLQIIYSIPLGYFIYYFIGGLSFFPFLNFIGVFVAAALGADDLFVAVDKWKNARIMNPLGSVEDIAEIALPDAASAMLLTTSTTAVAFFATCICPVLPILCFAVFCGLMIVCNYLMNVLLIFPALCIYDNVVQAENRTICSFFFNIGPKKVNLAEDERLGEDCNFDEDKKGKKKSLIHVILSTYYNFVHKFRWLILVICIGGISTSIAYGSTISLPESADVRLLPSKHPLELHLSWSFNLLSTILFSAGTDIEIHFGLKAGDNGNQNDPDQLTALFLDTTFDAGQIESQEYLLTFCDRLFEEDFVSKKSIDYICPINRFDQWIQEQAISIVPHPDFEGICGNAISLPMSPNDFDECFTLWATLNNENRVLSDRGKVKLLTVEGKANVVFGAPHVAVGNSWKSFENWFKNEGRTGPATVNKAFHTSGLWWWYDTSEQMLTTAIGAAGIALGFSAVIVLISSRSITLTIFSFVCIAYVLASTSATLVAIGWSLGFLESVCFAILVGISCDFVIHFGHAYIHYTGESTKWDRTRHSLLHMGPSILAAACTTFASALVMLFCKVVFFTKFATILMVTILHATLGSFVVYVVLCDLFGPSEPTQFIDGIVEKCGTCLRRNKQNIEAES